jgi:hypothetical protein
MMKKGLVCAIVVLFLGIGIQPVFANEISPSTTSDIKEDYACQDEYMTTDTLDLETLFRALDDKSAICSVLGDLLELFTSMGYKYPVLWDYILQDLCYDIIMLGVMWECWEYPALFIGVGIQPAISNELSISTTSVSEEDCGCQDEYSNNGILDIKKSFSPLDDWPLKCHILESYILLLGELCMKFPLLKEYLAEYIVHLFWIGVVWGCWEE